MTYLEIRQVAINAYDAYVNIHGIDAGNRLLATLRRGAAIPTNTEQLFMYDYVFGKMHHAKLLDAFDNFPINRFINNIRIIDWACGQGIASLVAMERIRNQANVEEVVLIEPSRIALQQACLHLSQYDTRIYPIHRRLEDLPILNIDRIPNLHLFSNIIDMQNVRIENVFNIIANNTGVDNYFIVVSPYINSARNTRLKCFKNHFSNQYQTFEDFYNVENVDKIERVINENTTANYTRSIKIFKV